uniref:Galactose-1-phosphate uridyl transferase N-terminal domain-containing protein n=1 Tax=Odontella aurita TaxID=265563 RepID=A0A7S4K5D2_9STRA
MTTFVTGAVGVLRHRARNHLNASLLAAHRRLFSSPGSVLRLDEMTGTWVVYASGRQDRPKQTASSSSSLKRRLADLPSHLEGCPFCAGNEHMTPDVLLSVGDRMRVVPNKFPAVDPLETSHIRLGGERCSFADKHPLNNEIPAVGFHEVVIESPYHNHHVAAAPDRGHARDLLTAFRERGLAHRLAEVALPPSADYADDDVSAPPRRIEHTVFFKNHGATAGASLDHPHSQIVSTPVVPVEAQRLQSLALGYFRKNRVNLYEKVAVEEMVLFEGGLGGGGGANASRVVDFSENFVAVVPYASPGPYVITIFPRYGGDGTLDGTAVDCSDFTSCTDDLLDECAAVLHSCLSRLHVLLDEPCFNLVVQTAPVPGRGVQAAARSSAFFRWHIRITPRLGAGAMAGFELGSGFFSNSHMPEDDAAELRAVRPFTDTDG